MKFRNEQKYCPHCGQPYDSFIDRCPKCQTKNLYTATRPGEKGLFWLDTQRQVIIFLLGFLGFQLIGFVISIIASTIVTMTTPNNDQAVAILSSPHLAMALNTLSYAFVLVALAIAMYPFLRDLFISLKKWKNLLFGLAMGIVLVISSIAYGLLIQLIPGLENLPSNDNQNNVSKLVLSFPITAVLSFAIVGPIVEELTYRVGLFTLTNRWNRILAYVITMLVFGFIHFDFAAGSKDAYIVELINIPSYIIAGSILCFTYEKFGFWGSTVAHITNNLVSVVSIVLGSMIA